MTKTNFKKKHSEVKNWSKKANKSGCSTDNTRLENYKYLIILMCRMLEWYNSFNISLVYEWQQTTFLKLLCIYGGVWYNERWYIERMLQRSVLINKITKIQRTRRINNGRSRTRLSMTCWVFPLWLQRHPWSLLWFVRFSFQLSSVICLFMPLALTNIV